MLGGQANQAVAFGVEHMTERPSGSGSINLSQIWSWNSSIPEKSLLTSAT